MVDEKDFYKDLIDNLYDGVYFVDPGRVITYWNKGAERITGYPAARVQGHSCRDNLLNHVTANGQPLCQDKCPLAACMQDGQVREAEVFLHHADGHRVPVVIRASPIRNAQGEIIGAVETFSNNQSVMKARRQLRALRREAHTDPLTGLVNRQALDGRLRALVAEYGPPNEAQGAAGLLFIDVDRFKQVNDAHGHEVGDRVLRMVAGTLRSSLRLTDTLGRWGGEEFLAILYDLDSPTALRAIADKLRSLIATSRLDLDGREVAVTISVGATLLRPGDSPEALVERADRSMYRAKRAGRNRTRLG